MRPQHVRRIPFSRTFSTKLTGLAPIYRIAHPNKLALAVLLVVFLVVVGVLVSTYGMQSNSKNRPASAHISSAPSASPDSTVISPLPAQHPNASAATPVTSQHQEITTDTRSTAQNGTNSTAVHVTVNGHAVPVPKNGTTERTITDMNGKTTVNISSNTTTSLDTNDSSSATTNIQLHTNTESQNSSMSGP